MTPHIQTTQTAAPLTVPQSTRFVNLEKDAASLQGVTIANDNEAARNRPNILAKRRRRHARLSAR